MSACLETAPSIAPSLPTTDARAARLAKFRREQLIVDYLNRGVSIAEIAARVGLSEKRMRAVIKEILAHRCPHPPEEFLAIQVSRLNEALLVAASAMSGANLKAVDRVVKIVSELDRYHGFAAFVGRRRPEPRLDAPAEGATTYGAALVCQARFAPGDDEEIEFERNTQFPLAPHQRGEGWGEGLGRLATVGARPQIPPQAFERVDSAPGLATSPTADDPLAPHQRGEGWGEGLGRLAAVGARLAPHPDLLPVNGEKGKYSTSDGRPENPAQDIEKVESEPGIATSPQASDIESPDVILIPGSSPGMPKDARWPVPMFPSFETPAPRTSQDEAAKRDSVRPDCYARPENPPQDIENVGSRPANDWAAEAPPALDETSIDTPMVLTPAGWGRPNIRMTLNGVAAS